LSANDARSILDQVVEVRRMLFGLVKTVSLRSSPGAAQSDVPTP
jgi:hypothetical protein